MHTIAGVQEKASKYQLYKLINLRDQGAAFPASAVEALKGLTITQVRDEYDDLDVAISKAEASGYIKNALKALPNLEDSVFSGFSMAIEAAFAQAPDSEKAPKLALYVVGKKLSIGKWKSIRLDDGTDHRATMLVLPHISDNAQMRAFARSLKESLSAVMGEENIIVSLA